MSAADKEGYIVEYIPKIGDHSYPEWVEDERWQCENPYADFKDACDYAESEYKRTGILHRVVFYENTVLRTFGEEKS